MRRLGHPPALVACDLDGTLLTPEGEVSARTADTLRRVLAAGVKIVLATGRPPHAVRPLAARLALRGPVVCSNGAVLYDPGADRVLSATLLGPAELRAAVAAALEAAPGCGFAVNRPAGAEAPAGLLTEPNYRHAWDEPDTAVVALRELLGSPATKLIVRHTGMTSGQLADLVRPALHGRLDVTYSMPHGLIELVPPGVTKAAGLARLLARRPSGPTLAFGDMPNDIAMLRWADHGVAMANAHPSVIAAADEVTSSNAVDGVARVLDRWF